MQRTCSRASRDRFQSRVRSVRRILTPKFRLGLFENPSVDPAHAQPRRLPLQQTSHWPKKSSTTRKSYRACGNSSELLHPHHVFGSRQKEGRLDFRDGDPAYEALKRACADSVGDREGEPIFGSRPT
jgi:beta-glucosidase-like glycosyl hydrolase